MKIIYIIAIGLVLDLLFGDPPYLPHPVRIMGHFVSLYEKVFCSDKHTRTYQLCNGIVLALLLIILSVVPVYWILWVLPDAYEIVVGGFLCYQMLAIRSLRIESMRVAQHLVNNDILGARKYLSWIVGRDTKFLEEVQITKATIETVAENTCDGCIAPLVYAFLGGVPLLFAYKAVNTLDSMIGYKNEKYEYFGKFAAKLDDILNFVPAEFAAWCMMGASAMCGLDYKNAWRIYWRDKRNHASPNSAKTESVCAGALNVQLAGPASYGGRLVDKPTIGDDNRMVATSDIGLANRLMMTTVFVALILLSVVKFCVI